MTPAVRHRAAAARHARTYRFYWQHRCRMVRVHLLSSSALLLARFAEASPTFHAIGEMLAPVNAAGEPRTDAWATYAAACVDAAPRDLREELWITAHLRDVEAVREAGLVGELDAEDHPLLPLLKEHAAITLGSRDADVDALAGQVPAETAVAVAVRRGLGRLMRSGRPLVRHYVTQALSTLVFGDDVPDEALGARRVALETLWFAASSWTAMRVYRLGVRRAERGAAAAEREWSMVPSLRRVFGDDTDRLDPLVLAFFDDMSRFEIKAAVQLHTVYASWLAWAGTLFVGQGMFEDDLQQVDARFRLFKRGDGTLHFLREFFAGDAVRVFDSDFVVRDWQGTPCFFEVFVDIDTVARMKTTITDDGGLVMQVAEVLSNGVRRPPDPFYVAFTTRRVADSVDVEGVLEMRPRPGWQTWLFSTLLRRPRELGGIRYVARLRESEG